MASAGQLQVASRRQPTTGGILKPGASTTSDLVILAEKQSWLPQVFIYTAALADTQRGGLRNPSNILKDQPD